MANNNVYSENEIAHLLVTLNKKKATINKLQELLLTKVQISSFDLK